MVAFQRTKTYELPQSLREHHTAVQARPESVKLHGPVTAQRIAKWIKNALGEAGIDTTEFSAHSTRGAAATAAIKQGVTTAEVLKMADWSTDSTFKRHYYRPNSDPVFAHGVLRGTEPVQQ